jgi:hypothetical protein
MNERVFIKNKPKTDTFHKHSKYDPDNKPVYEENTGWIVFQKDGRIRKAKPLEVPRKLTSGVRSEDGVNDVDVALANLLPDENESKKIPRKRRERL